MSQDTLPDYNMGLQRNTVMHAELRSQQPAACVGSTIDPLQTGGIHMSQPQRQESAHPWPQQGPHSYQSSSGTQAFLAPYCPQQ